MANAVFGKEALHTAVQPNDMVQDWQDMYCEHLEADLLNLDASLITV